MATEECLARQLRSSCSVSRVSPAGRQECPQNVDHKDIVSDWSHWTLAGLLDVGFVRAPVVLSRQHTTNQLF
jgi:hypothetical protein